MASLTDQLSQATGARQVIDPTGGVGGVNALGSVLEMGSKFTEIFSRNRDEARRSQQQAIENERAKYRYDKERLQDQAGAAAVRAIAGVEDLVNAPRLSDSSVQQADPFLKSGGEGPSVFDVPRAPTDLEIAAGQAAGKVKAVELAIKQGTMPSISRGAALTQAYQSLLNTFPGGEEAIAKVFRDQGINTLQGYEDENKLHEEARDSEATRNEAYIKRSEEAFGAESLTMSREDKILKGMNLARDEYNFNVSLRNLQSVQAQVNLSEAEKKANEGVAQHDMVSNFVTGAYNQVSPFVTALNKQVLAISKLPAGQQGPAFAEMQMKYKLAGNQLMTRLTTQAMAQGVNAEGMNQIRTAAEGIFSQLDSVWSGDFSALKARADTLTSFKQASGLSEAQLMPTYAFFRNAGLSDELVMQFSKTLQEKPEIRARLQQELSSAGSVMIGQDRASTHLLDVARLALGETSWRSIDPAKAPGQIALLYDLGHNMTKAFNAGTAPNSARQILNIKGELIDIAGDRINPQSSLDTLEKAVGGFADQQTRWALGRMLSDPSNKELAQVTIQGSRAASMKVAEAVRPKLKAYDNKYWTVDIAPDGKYYAKRLATPKGNITNEAQLGQAFKGAESVQRMGVQIGVRPPTEMTRTINVANANLENLVTLAAHDPDGPKGSTPMELRRYYASYGNMVPSSMKTNSAAKPTDPTKEVQKGQEALDKMFDELLVNVNQPIAATGAPKKGGYAPRESSGGDNTDVQVDNYIGSVSSKAGVTPDTPLTAENLPLVVDAMIAFETGGKATSKAMRNKNPGNLEDGDFAKSQPGYVGTDGRFAQFDTIENGKAAMTKLLSRRYLARGQNTVRSIIEGI